MRFHALPCASMRFHALPWPSTHLPPTFHGLPSGVRSSARAPSRAPPGCASAARSPASTRLPPAWAGTYTLATRATRRWRPPPSRPPSAATTGPRCPSTLGSAPKVIEAGFPVHLPYLRLISHALPPSRLPRRPDGDGGCQRRRGYRLLHRRLLAAADGRSAPSTDLPLTFHPPSMTFTHLP